MCIILPLDAADSNWQPTDRRGTGMMQFITTLNHTHTFSYIQNHKLTLTLYAVSRHWTPRFH